MATWSDPFTGPVGSPVDPDTWTPTINGAGGGNSELEYYTHEAVALDGNGNLVLTAARDNGTYTAWYGPSQYTSGKVWTLGNDAFQYGHIEATIALPGTAGQPGAWPAFWLLGADYPTVGWPECGEIDIMESFGSLSLPNQISSSVHTPTDNFTQAYNFPEGSDATHPHTYAVDWRPTSLIFSVDGNAFASWHRSQFTTWLFDKPFFIILNLAVGGTMGGAVPASADLPYQMQVSDVSATNCLLT